MKATELRLGNLVYVISRAGGVHLPIEIPMRVLQIGMFNSEILQSDIDPSQSEKWYKHSNSDLSPIPLTEQWLEKFGFIFDKETKYWLTVSSAAIDYGVGESIGKSGWWFMDYKTRWSYIKKVKYVHQLQNLYFALTGEELKVKELV